MTNAMFSVLGFKAQWDILCLPISWYSLQFNTCSLLHKDPHSIAGNLCKLWPILAGSFDHGTSGTDHQRTSCASSRKMLSFYLGVYSGSCCRTQIPSGASFLQLTFSTMISCSQPSSLARGQNAVEGTDAQLLLLSFSCLSVSCSMLEFWPAASGCWEPMRPLC